MRRPTQIISLVLMVLLGIQSCAVSFGGSLSEELSSNGAERQQAEDLSGAGGLGMLAALLWLIGAALVMSRPKASAWLFGAAAPLCAIGAGNGFTDLWFWAAASAALALMSWRGIREKARQEADERERHRADVEAAAAALLAKAPGASDDA